MNHHDLLREIRVAVDAVAEGCTKAQRSGAAGVLLRRHTPLTLREIGALFGRSDTWTARWLADHRDGVRPRMTCAVRRAEAALVEAGFVAPPVPLLRDACEVIAVADRLCIERWADLTGTDRASARIRAAACRLLREHAGLPWAEIAAHTGYKRPESAHRAAARMQPGCAGWDDYLSMDAELLAMRRPRAAAREGGER